MNFRATTANDHEAALAAGGPAQPVARGFATLRRPHLFVLAIAALLQIIDGFDLLSMSVVASSVAAQWSLSPAALGVIFSSAQLSALVAAAAVVTLSNRFGRKPLLVVATVLVGVGSLASALSSSATDLLASRLLTGVGLGVIAPMIVGYTSEFMPTAARGLAVGIVSSSLFLGYIVGGLVAAAIIPTFSWRAVFLLGSVTPLLLAPLMLALPPSPIGLKRRGGADAMVARICARFGIPVPAITAAPAARSSFLLRRFTAIGAGRALASAGVAIACCGLIVYFLISWLPSLTQQAGLSARASLIASSALSLGAFFGNGCSGWAMDRWSPYAVLATMLTAGAATLAVLPLVPPVPAAVLAMSFLVGFCAMGSAPSVLTFCSIVFPADLRMEALATMTVISRVAGFVAPSAAGLILAGGGGGTQLFIAAAGIAFVGAVSVAISGAINKTTGAALRARNRQNDASGCARRALW